MNYYWGLINVYGAAINEDKYGTKHFPIDLESSCYFNTKKLELVCVDLS